MLDVLNRKIRQLHAALGDITNLDLSTVPVEFGVGDGWTSVEVDFNKDTDEIALANSVSLLIANIASLKDHLKAWCAKHDVPFQGEKLINNNRAVALVHDLWNIDKHAVLSKPPRSGHQPKIENLRKGLHITTTKTGGSAVFSINPRTGSIRTDAANGGSIQLAVTGQVVDESGAFLGDLTAICSEAVVEWEKVLSEAGVPLPA